MPQQRMPWLPQISLGLAAWALLASSGSWLANQTADGVDDGMVWINLLFPALLGVMFGARLRPKYVWGYAVLTLGVTGGLISYAEWIGNRPEGFAILYEVLVMVAVQTAVMLWRFRRNPEPL
ncbi:hypothetical protein EV700_2734 [Fluviicoccus keumensis]|uniref:Membrane protein DUF2069 n=1 Tax=Fluviicoccus keumensis TaxID=1435465 RepID=A0A4V2G3S9_9GAMM|nr:hypothetical protein [Fluviicoccus keumensis]RZU38156.1 hypothetical protein EV700_2734 [Fluviicoccus keumensis]